jgi:lipoprotein NlpI
VAVAYNLGVAAALGNRREEARTQFVQVTQADPRNVGAWLYLANLATTPLEAWSFLQQARSIEPGNPAVQEAVSVVWPQVRHLYNNDSELPQ